MKILLSAYACEPHRGSEPGLGWQWAVEIAKLGHEVHVLTRANNQILIEQELKQNPVSNLHFIYFDKTGMALSLKKKMGRIGVSWYYLIWQFYAYRFIKKQFSSSDFDLIHHITFGLFRVPSFLWKLHIPFVFGPVGGGEVTPWKLRRSYPLKGWMIDCMRDLSIASSKINPFLYRMYQHADLILTRTLDTKSRIPVRFQSKTFPFQDIGINRKDLAEVPRDLHKQEEIRILHTGRMIYWKGMHLGLRAFQHIASQLPEVSLSMVGKGDQKERLQRQAEKLGIQDRIQWHGFVSNESLTQMYRSHDLFLFTSLHESGGTVVLEAMTRAMPVAAFNIGGPAITVSNETGLLIEVAGKTEAEVVEELSNRIISLLQDPHEYQHKSIKTLERVRKYTWTQLVSEVYECIGQHIQTKQKGPNVQQISSSSMK